MSSELIGLVNDSCNILLLDDTNLSLRIVEVGGNRDHGLRDGVAQEGVSSLLHLGQDH